MILNTLNSNSSDAVRALVFYRIMLATADQNPLTEGQMAKVVESVDTIFALEEPDRTIIKNSAYPILEELADEAPMFEPRKVWLGLKTLYGGTEGNFLSVKMEYGIKNALEAYNRVAATVSADEAVHIAHMRLIDAFAPYADAEGPAGRVLCWLLDQILSSKLELKTLSISP